MKKIIILLLTLCSFSSTYSQDLNKLLKLTDDLRHEILKFKNDSMGKQTIKSDTIFYTGTVHDDEKIKTKTPIEILTVMINSYKNKAFDDLINSSTKLSVKRDKQLIGDNEETKSILSDLDKYFSAEELLSEKYNDAKIKNALKQLDEIKQSSELLLEKLKNNLKDYKDLNDELKKTLNKLVSLDERLSVANTETQKLKFTEEIIELINYMYNYYSYVNYPHLSKIFFEIIKRKRSDADAKIDDLFKELQ